jgi:hypothetical protein
MKNLAIAILAAVTLSTEALAFPSTIGDSVVGCQDREKLEKLLSYARAKDTEAFTKAMLLGISDGSCHMFQAGDSVEVTDVKWTGLNQVRPRGSLEEFWIVREALKR